MPRLMFFGTCQKAIIDRSDGNVSMIGLLHSIVIKMPAASVLPDDALVPATWASVASWVREADDQEKTFQSKVELFSSSGEIFTTVEGDPFTIHTPSYSTTTNSNGFPVGQQGIYTIKVSLKEVGEDQWEEKGSCTIEVSHVFVEGSRSA